MKKTLLLFIALVALAVGARATDVTIAASTQPGFNPTGAGTDVTLTNVSVTNASATVTCSTCLRAQWVGLSGFKIKINTVTYDVATVTDRSTLTLTTVYAGSSSTTATVLWYKYVVIQIYSDRSFRPAGSTTEVQPGVPGSGAWFRRYAASIINDGATSTLYIPAMTVYATTDALDNVNARYTFGFYRPDGSFIQFYTCSPSVAQLRVPTTSPTTLPDLCIFNAGNSGPSQPDQFYTKVQIDNRFPSCSFEQMLYFAATGNVTSCLNVGTNLSIDGNTLNATGGSSGCGSGTTNLVMKFTASTTCGDTALAETGTGSSRILTFIPTSPGASLTSYAPVARLNIESEDSTASIHLLGLNPQIYSTFFTGTLASPAAPSTGNTIFSHFVRAQYSTTPGQTNSSVAIRASATQAWSSTARGASYSISTEANTSSATGAVSRFLINQLGAVHVAPSGATPTYSSTTGTATVFQVGGTPETGSSTVDNLAVSFLGPNGDVTEKQLVVQQANEQQAAIIETQYQNGTPGWGVYPVASVSGHYVNWLGTSNPPAVSAAGSARMFVSSGGVFRCSENGGAYVNCVGSGGSSLPVVDTTSIVEGSSDATKEIRFEVDGLTTGTIRVLTPPDANITIAGQNFANSFSVAQTITPTGSLTLGTASSATGQVTFKNSTNANNTIVQPGAPASSLTFTLPATLPASAGCLQVDSTGVITQTGSACGSGGSGDVVGPASATDNAIARFDSTTGKLLQNSTATIGDTGGVIFQTTDNATRTSHFRNSTDAIWIDVDAQDVSGSGRARIVFESGGTDVLRFKANDTTANLVEIGQAETLTVTGSSASNDTFVVTSASNTSQDLLELTLVPDDTSTVANFGNLTANSNGTAATGFGQSLTWKLESSTTNGQDAARLSALWTDATHATRTSAIVLSTVNSAGALAERFRIGGTGVSISGGANITSVLSATASLNFANALAAQTCDVLTITVTGATDGNVVTLGVPTALAANDLNTTFHGWVSAADTVSVKRCNIGSAATGDPAAATVRATVVQH